jgi:hypothetical protein
LRPFLQNAGPEIFKTHPLLHWPRRVVVVLIKSVGEIGAVGTAPAAVDAAKSQCLMLGLSDDHHCYVSVLLMILTNSQPISSGARFWGAGEAGS